MVQVQITFIEIIYGALKYECGEIVVVQRATADCGVVLVIKSFI